MSQYMVVGGRWKDTGFKSLDHDTLEMYGPYGSFDAAADKWRGVAQLNVDDAHHRVFVAPFDIDPKTNQAILRFGGEIVVVEDRY